MKRRAIAGGLGVLALTACVHAPTPEHGGVERFDRWFSAQHLTVTPLDIPLTVLDGSNGCAAPRGTELLLDLPCMDAISGPQWLAFWIRHEEGHIVAFRLGLRFMPDGGKIGEEEKAQCVAIIIEGRVAPVPAQLRAQGYWPCPEPYRTRVRAAMVLAGMW